MGKILVNVEDFAKVGLITGGWTSHCSAWLGLILWHQKKNLAGLLDLYLLHTTYPKRRLGSQSLLHYMLVACMLHPIFDDLDGRS
jgi:hypothetical protein